MDRLAAYISRAFEPGSDAGRVLRVASFLFVAGFAVVAAFGV